MTTHESPEEKSSRRELAGQTAPEDDPPGEGFAAQISRQKSHTGCFPAAPTTRSRDANKAAVA